MIAKKAGRKYVLKVANACLGMVMKEKRSGEVTRREQIALAFGIALGMTVCADGTYQFDGDEVHDAARLIMNAIDSLPGFRAAQMEMVKSGAPCVGVAAVLERG